MIARTPGRRYGYKLLGRFARAGHVPRREQLAHRLLRHPATLTYRDTLGFRRRTDLGDIYEACLFLGVDLFLLPREVVERVAPGATVVDAGAHTGVVTAQLCRAVGPAGAVHAIEPLPANARRLRELKSDNHLDQLTVWECAVSDRDETVSLRTTGAADGSPHSSLTASNYTGATVSVAARALDGIVAEGARVGFIKVDIEGAESLMLDGAQRIMRSDRPLVFCEFNEIHLRDAGSSADELLRRFEDLGYKTAHEYPQADAIVDRFLIPT